MVLATRTATTTRKLKFKYMLSTNLLVDKLNRTERRTLWIITVKLKPFKKWIC